jgi:predicted  nucleic acid-binding Zn-ribbon protein
MELSSLKNYLETLEERQIEAMVALEEAESDRETAAVSLDQVAADRIADNAALAGERSGVKAEIASLEAERTVAIHAVNADDRELYNRLRLKRAGVAVASASTRTCGACGTTLNNSLYQAARSPAQLTFCDTCGRVLYAV